MSIPHTPWTFAQKNNFSAGELASSMEGRSDTPLYQNGVKKMINWMVLPSGGIVRRPGTMLVHAFANHLREEISPMTITVVQQDKIFEELVKKFGFKQEQDSSVRKALEEKILRDKKAEIEEQEREEEREEATRKLLRSSSREKLEKVQALLQQEAPLETQFLPIEGKKRKLTTIADASESRIAPTSVHQTLLKQDLDKSQFLQKIDEQQKVLIKLFIETHTLVDKAIKANGVSDEDKKVITENFALIAASTANPEEIRPLAKRIETILNFQPPQ